MKQYIKLLFALVFISGLSLQAQEKTLEKGNEEYEDLAYIDARQAYLKVIEDGFQSEEIYKKLGDSYYYTADYKPAAKWYGALYDLGNRDAEYLYKYALSLKSDQSYVASDQVMEEFLNVKGEEYRAKLYINERNYLEEIEEQSGRFELKLADFNSKLSDFAPAFYLGNVVFASNREKRASVKLIHDWNEQPFLDLYKVNTLGESESENIEEFNSNINTKYHESTAVFTRDGNTMYFTRNNYTNEDYKVDQSGTNRLKLYRATKSEEDNNWTVEELPFNSDEYSVAHPALSVDEKTLYFASDKPGGKGLSDLYKVSIEGSGFGTIESLGDGINTEGRETFPFISQDSKMYFSSDGHVGLGGLDVFVVEVSGANSFGEVFNVGEPINSPVDDFSFIIKRNGFGYFASNRESGVGDDDIYSFKSTKPLITSLSCNQTFVGVVKDERSDNPISKATVMLIDADGKVVEESTSAYDGAFRFENLKCNSQYSVRAKKADFSTVEKPFATGKGKGVVERSLFLGRGNDLAGSPMAVSIGSDLVKVLGLNPIYFDLDKSFIRRDAEIELQKVIAVMKMYPAMKIDIRSHTDSRAKDNYNMDLSERRAQSTMNYLIKQGGIDAARLTAKGYGETRLMNRCENGVNCAEYEHQLNRRSEFIIVE